jgi:tRNA-specific 2-thiouridylase
VTCNQQIKFADLFDMARDLGADVLATGHYISSRADGAERALFRAADADRDQSYFLFATTRDQLRLLRFPLGDMRKPDVREHARRFGLAVADKPDSQDICFVPTGRYSEVVERLAPQAARPGDIVHIDGRVLGQHGGVMHYTIGQRKGLGLGAGNASAGEPLYVIKIDAGKARVTVGPRTALATRRVLLRDVNWIGPGAFETAAEAGLEIAARVRSTRPPAPALLELKDGEPCVAFPDDESGVAPGQACVFYEHAGPGARVLGGGFIRSAEPATASAPAAQRAARA